MLDYYGKTYTTKKFAVSCATGIFADSVTGKKLIPCDNGSRQSEIDPDSHVKSVNKKTLKTYYSYVYTAVSDNKLSFAVCRADHVNKHGLDWKVIYEALLGPNGIEDEIGYQCEEHWLSEKGFSKISTALLIQDGNPNLPELAFGCASSIYDFAAVPYPMPESDILTKWASGKLIQCVLRTSTFKELGFGLELEFTGITRFQAARTIAICFDTSVHGDDDGYLYKTYHVSDSGNRVWTVKCDSSIAAVDHKGNSSSNDKYQCELVTPICKYEDIPLIQDIVRYLRQRGMKSNASCGVHVHVDASAFSAENIGNLSILMAYYESLLFEGISVRSNRENYCQKTDSSFWINFAVSKVIAFQWKTLKSAGMAIA